MYHVVKCQALAANDECSSENPTNCPKQALLFHLGSFWSNFEVLLQEHTPGIPTHDSGGCPYSQIAPW